MFLSRHLPWKHSKIKWLVVDWVRFSFRVTGIDRPSDDTENCLAPDSSTSKGSLLSDLRPALDLCHAATRLSAGGVADDEWVTQLLRQGDSQVFRKYSRMKLQMKREALEKLNHEGTKCLWNWVQPQSSDGILVQFWYCRTEKRREVRVWSSSKIGKCFRIRVSFQRAF
jgi:hypothetical protein